MRREDPADPIGPKQMGMVRVDQAGREVIHLTPAPPRVAHLPGLHDRLEALWTEAKAVISVWSPAHACAGGSELPSSTHLPGLIRLLIVIDHVDEHPRTLQVAGHVAALEAVVDVTHDRLPWSARLGSLG